MAAAEDGLDKCVGGGRASAPASLYGKCLRALLHSLNSRASAPAPEGPRAPARAAPAHLLPDNVLLDLYQTMFEVDSYMLCLELSNLDIFHRILKANYSQLRLLQYFQAVIECRINLSKRLSWLYIEKCDNFKLDSNNENVDTLIDLGLRLGGFLNDAGWYGDAEKVLLACKELCQSTKQTSYYVSLTLECCHRLLHAQSSYRSFAGAADTYAFSLILLKSTMEASHSNEVFNNLKDDIVECSYTLDNFKIDKTDEIKSVQGINERSKTPYYCRSDEDRSEEMNNLLLRLYKEFAMFHFLKSDYNLTFTCSLKALKLLSNRTPARIAVDVLRICGKACVNMRKFGWAELLIQQAVARARVCYGRLHPKYASALLDYGFYFLNVDCILNSVTVYEEALGILDRIYNGNNLLMAIAHEDLSYALYVHEYSSGRFFKAREHIDRAIRIVESLLPPEHLLLATTKRVKALILEEIALDSLPNENSRELLLEAESLHQSALKLSLNSLGEMNVQTAKHYGNLGRLYQSMKKFKEAEEMQLRAIKIKEKLLGCEDYEVGLSLGHLASLYNYHMKMYAAAEKLYYRSISISLKSYGEEYSGLEYDYIGLIHVNTELKRPDRAVFYTQLLDHWKRMRDLSAEKKYPDFGQEVEISISELQSEIFDEDVS